MLLAEVRGRDGHQCRVCHAMLSDGALRFRILNPGTTLTVDGVVVVCVAHQTRGAVQPAPGRPYWFDCESTVAAPVKETEAAPHTGGDAASFPKLAASIPSTSDTRFSTAKVSIPNKYGVFAKSRSTPYVTTQFWRLVAVSMASSVAGVVLGCVFIAVFRVWRGN